MDEQKTTLFSDIAADFNASAAKFLGSPEFVDLLLTKYSALQSFRLKDQDDKEHLAGALFDTCEKFLAGHAVAGQFPEISDDYLAAAGKLLGTLAEPENALLLPRRAPAALADVALAFVNNAETAGRANFSTWAQYGDYRKAMKTLAPLTLKCAKKIQAVADRHAEELSTSKNFTVPRPMVLKKGDKDRAP